MYDYSIWKATPQRQKANGSLPDAGKGGGLAANGYRAFWEWHVLKLDSSDNVQYNEYTKNTELYTSKGWVTVCESLKDTI